MPRLTPKALSGYAGGADRQLAVRTRQCRVVACVGVIIGLGVAGHVDVRGRTIVSQFCHCIGRGNFSQPEAASRLRLMNQLTRVALILLIGIFLGVALNMTVKPVRGQSADPSQVLIDVFNEAAESMGWDSTWRASAANVHSANGQTFLGITVLVNSSNQFCGNRTNMAVITFLPTADEASQYLSNAYKNDTVESFHGQTAYRKVNIAEHGGYKFQDWLAWSMGNYVFVIGDLFDCPAEGLPGDELDATPFADAIYAAAVNHGLGQNINPNPPEPNPNPAPNPEPNPQPNPSPIDPVVLKTLQSLLGTPIIPITGAIAGGLVAWVISMLGGGKPVPSTPVNSSKAISAYQQKWIQKGWKINSKTGQLEVQPGATDDAGHVWYKLPYDESNSHCWVDKSKVEECERSLAQGLVYDHKLSGWIEPNDLAKYESQKADWHQQNIEDSANQNARIQQGIKDAQAQRDADYKKWEQDFDKKEDIRSQMDEEKYNAFKAGLKTTYYDNWGKVFGGVETTADVAIALGAKFVPGGKAIEKSYEIIKRVALSVDEGIDKGSVTTAVVDYTKRAIKDKVVSTVSSVLSLKNVSKPLDKMAKKVLTKGSRTGLKIYDAVTGKAKDKFIEGEMDEALESDKGQAVINYVGDSMKGDNLATGMFR